MCGLACPVVRSLCRIGVLGTALVIASCQERAARSLDVGSLPANQGISGALASPPSAAGTHTNPRFEACCLTQDPAYVAASPNTLSFVTAGRMVEERVKGVNSDGFAATTLEGSPLFVIRAALGVFDCGRGDPVGFYSWGLSDGVCYRALAGEGACEVRVNECGNDDGDFRLRASFEATLQREATCSKAFSNDPDAGEPEPEIEWSMGVIDVVIPARPDIETRSKMYRECGDEPVSPP